MTRFEGRVALITGAAGWGIGRTVTRRLCEEGAAVLAVDVDDVGLAETERLVEGKVIVRQVDVADPEACVGGVVA